MNVQIVVTNQTAFLVARILRFINANNAEGSIALKTVVAAQIADRKIREM